MSVTRPASIPAIRTALPSRSPWPSRKITSNVLVAARKPGPPPARATMPRNPATAATTTSPTVTSRRAAPVVIGAPSPEGRRRPNGLQAGRFEQGRAERRPGVVDEDEPTTVDDQDRDGR